MYRYCAAHAHLACSIVILAAVSLTDIGCSHASNTAIHVAKALLCQLLVLLYA